MFQSQAEFERVIMPQAASLLRFARRLQGSEAAEDLVQETLLLAWRGFRQLAEHSNARAWLFRILINASYGKGRKARTSPETVPLADHAGRAASSSVIDRLEWQQALVALTEEQRTVLLLAIVEGFTCREVAEILSLPLGTVTSRLSRGRQTLRDVLTSAHSAKGF